MSGEIGTIAAAALGNDTTGVPSAQPCCCAFCGKPNTSVRLVIKGDSGAVICDECTLGALNIITSECDLVTVPRGTTPRDASTVPAHRDEPTQDTTGVVPNQSYAALVAERDALLAIKKAAWDYFEYAVQDEAEERDCCVDDEQHRRAIALRDALGFPA